MSITDAISALISLLFACNGWNKGILRIILGPIAMIAASVASYAYYQATQNILISLVIGLFGPFIIKLGLELLLRLWKDNRRSLEPQLVSRALGATAGFLWGACIIVLTVVLIAVVPLPDSMASLQKIQNDVKRSFIYTRLPFSFGQNSTGGQTADTLKLLNNEQFAETIKNSGEYKTLMDDPDIQALITDEETIKQIEKKDLGKLLTNSKFQKILQDPKLLQKMINLQTKINTTPQKPKP